MELITGNQAISRLEEINLEAMEVTSHVDAAVAYVSETKLLFEVCWEYEIRKVTLRALYNKSIPVSVPVLEWFLSKGAKNANYVCTLVPGYYHPKVIWWHGFGVYIGSANLSHPAWYYNIEVGIFLHDEELAEQGLEEGLVQFFEDIDDEAKPLTREILAEMQKLTRGASPLSDAERLFLKSPQIPERQPKVLINRPSLLERRRKRFLDEWNSTLSILRNISENVSSDKYRPTWIAPSTPKGAQADQFLNAFYYQQVGGTNQGVRDFHEENEKDIQRALDAAMTWWKHVLPTQVSAEKETLDRWAPFLSHQFERNTLLHLSREDFADICLHVHAMLEHARQVRYSALGMKRSPGSMSKTERCRHLAYWLYDRRASNGLSTIQLLDYVLYGGDLDRTPERIFEVCHTPEMNIPHLGPNSVGEIVGWAKPNEMPPRNGRTNKALHALGYNMKDLSDKA